MVYIVCNVGGAEKTLRTAMGAVLLGVGIFAPIRKSARVALGAAGAVELMTALTDYCPINVLLRRNTCPTAHQPHD